MTLHCLERNDLPEGETQLGLEITVEDKGPGIANLAQVLADRGQRGRALEVLARGLSLAPAGHPLHPTLEATQAEIRHGMKGPGVRGY